MRAGAATSLRLERVDVLCGGGRWVLANSVTQPHQEQQQEQQEQQQQQQQQQTKQPTQGGGIPSILFQPSVSEMSVVRDPATGSWQVVSLRMMENRIKLCRTPDGPDASPAGPYSCDFSPQLPPPWDAKDYNTHARGQGILSVATQPTTAAKPKPTAAAQPESTTARAAQPKSASAAPP
jgi:hypothetical protein